MKTAIEKLDDTELNGRRVRLIEDRRGGRGGGKLEFIKLLLYKLFELGDPRIHFAVSYLFFNQITLKMTATLAPLLRKR